MRDPVEAYYTALRDIRSSGMAVDEVSYYGPLETLFNEVGKGLKPKVQAVMQLKNHGAGNPDGGLFPATVVKAGVDQTTLLGGTPWRSAVEVKGSAADAFEVAESEQVRKYLDKYGLVLVTNLRDFVLVGTDPDTGELRLEESLQLARTEAAFWGLVATPRVYAEKTAEGLAQFLQRVMLRKAPLAEPKQVAWFLASYARTARLRLEHRDLPALDQLRVQLEGALGLKFEGDKGDHFFRSTLVQTLFYGMFASWVLWSRSHPDPDARFEWQHAAATLHVPMVSELFYQFANPAKLGPLGIAEVLDWAQEVFNRIDRAAFFSKFQEEHAVQYFYEPFLEAFDPDLRKELGVWYTPDEVVRYMVARVDWALRSELGIADGLADPSVVVLDPCCGTGAYLVEVLRKIDGTLAAKGADALTRHDVKRAAMDRVIGFEIMPAPFVIAHLNLGILLAELGVPLRDETERAAVYLTNALTGWGDGTAPPKLKPKHQIDGQMHSTLLFPEFAEERDAANRVKREEKILVVIGNPPYNGFAGVAEYEEANLLRPFKERRAAWGVSKNKLDDLYIRFFSLALHRIARTTGRGVVSFISNDSWIVGPSYVTVREALLQAFDSFWIEGMHGDRSMSEYGPDGRTSQTVFATPGFSPGIRQGVAVSLWVRASQSSTAGVVHYRSDIDDSDAVERRRHLLQTLTDGGMGYVAVTPDAANRLLFKPVVVEAAYMDWPTVADLSRVAPMLGLNENRGESLIDQDASRLRERIAAYLDPLASDDTARLAAPGLFKSWARFDNDAARSRILGSASFSSARVRPFQVKPMDVKWAYLDSTRPLWNEPRPALQEQALAGVDFVLVRTRAPKQRDGAAMGYSVSAFDQHALHKDAYAIPTRLVPVVASGGAPALDLDRRDEANLSARAAHYIREIGLSVDGGSSTAVWMHTLAIGFAPRYLEANADGISGDWPRIPLPASAALLDDSAALGDTVAHLLTGQEVAQAAPVLLGLLSSAAGGQLGPADLGVRAQWGIQQRAGVVTPSKGKLAERAYDPEELVAIAERAAMLGMTRDAAVALLGETCFDVYLNDVAYWKCVPANVWRYTIGGYQVIKKWLSYRERALLGRDLEPEEARYVSEMVRRIGALILMQPELDANYERVKANVWAWGQGGLH